MNISKLSKQQLMTINYRNEIIKKRNYIIKKQKDIIKKKKLIIYI
jgi:hypothetical protein